MLYFTSDDHFYHRNILQYTRRHEIWNDPVEMTLGLRDRWNAIVKPTDTVYNLGDLTFHTDVDRNLEFLSSLNGEKHLVLGNHDKTIKKNHSDFLKVFTTITNYAEINYNGQHIVAFHYGQRTWNRQHYGSWHLFGHSHSTLPPYGKSVDVGVDSTWITGKPEYRPFSFDEIKTFMDQRELVKGFGD